MSKENDLQTDVVKAVRANGGFAKKLSHRFLVGVPDLLIKVQPWPALLVEVKRQVTPKRADTLVTLAVSGPQLRMLNEAHGSGMNCAVLSFLETPETKRIGIRFFEFTYELKTSGFQVLQSQHSWFMVKDRGRGIWNDLIRHLKEIKWPTTPPPPQ